MGLKVADVDFDLDVLLVLGKGRRERALPFGRKSAVVLDRYLRVHARHKDAERPWLWLGMKGRLTDVVRAAVDDRNCDDTRDLVRMVLFRALDDLWEQAKPRAEHHARLRLVVDLPLPSVDRPDWREVVASGTDSIDDELLCERGEPVRIWRGDDDLTDFIHCGLSPVP
jgi:hypothetical protein